MQGGEEMELGKQIKKYRQESQLSQEELANRVYVSRQTISNWENDKSYPDVTSLVLLSEVFQISLDKFIKGDIEKLRKDSYRTIILLLIVIVLTIPLAVLFHWYGIAVSVFLAIVTLFYAL